MSTNSILITGLRGDAPPGLVLTFIAIGILIYSWESWKRHNKLTQEIVAAKTDVRYYKPRIILLSAVLIGMLLPVIRTLIEQNRVGIIKRGAYQSNIFEVYSGQAFMNLFLFILLPFLISSIIVLIKKEFPSRIFFNLVMISVAFFSFLFVLSSFHQR